MDRVERFAIWRLTGEGREKIEATVAREFPLTIILNDRELVTLLCSPANLRYLAGGFLTSEGFINNKDKIKSIIVDDRRGVVRVETNTAKGFANELIFKRVCLQGVAGGLLFTAPLTPPVKK